MASVQLPIIFLDIHSQNVIIVSFSLTQRPEYTIKSCS